MPSARSLSADAPSRSGSRDGSPSPPTSIVRARGRSRSPCPTCNGSRTPSRSRSRSPISRYGRPLRLLSLDGGGVRGLSSVMMLQHIMKEVNASREIKLEPYDIFDLIGGTSTGGLIAIMLGRLHMTLDEVENAFVQMSEQIFGPRKRSWWNAIGKLHDYVAADARFDDEKLKEAISEKICEKGFSPNELLQDPNMENDGDGCRVFVCAIREGNASSATLRSYKIPQGVELDFDSLKICDAAKATASAKTYFGSTRIAKFHQKFSDGALAYNNPIRIVYREAQQVWRNETDFLLISLGTGAAPGPMVSGGAIKLAKALVRLVTQTERVWEDFFYDHEVMTRQNRLFRFNVNQGLAEVSLDDYKAKDKIADATQTYLTEPGTRQLLEKCVKELRDSTQEMLYRKDREISAEMCADCHGGIKFMSLFKFCRICLTKICFTCASDRIGHPRDHKATLSEAVSWRWAGGGSGSLISDRKRCVVCNDPPIGVKCRIQCANRQCDLALCESCFTVRKRTRVILKDHSETHKSHRRLEFIRPPLWKVVDHGRYQICPCDKGQSCVEHCERCGDAVFLGDVVYNCNKCLIEYGMCQTLCQKCRDKDDNGDRKRAHEYKSTTYRFHEEWNPFNEIDQFMMCRKCSIEFKFSRNWFHTLMSHEHFDFDVYIGPRFLEDFRNRAYRNCPKRANLEAQDGEPTPYSCHLCEREICFDTVTAKCTKCESKYCSVCQNEDMIGHFHSARLTTCVYKKQLPDRDILHHITCSACKQVYRKSKFTGFHCAICSKFFLCFDKACIKSSSEYVEHVHDGRPAPLICILPLDTTTKDSDKGGRGRTPVGRPV